MSQKLDEIRKKIDGLDNNIHDLLMERAALILDVAKEKKKNKLPIVHPARESQMIRRLLKRHKGALPESAILSIWRELVGAVCMMQTGLNVVVADNKNFHSHWDMAKNYFGSVLPLSKSATPLMAIAALRDSETSFAVVPWPEEGVDTGVEKPWWYYVFSNEERLQVACALPYGYTDQHAANGFLGIEPKAMIISRNPFLESGNDHTCFVLEVDHSVSRARIVEVFEEAHIKPVALYTKSGIASGDHSVHMIIVEGYKMDDQTIIPKLEKEFEGLDPVCKAIGGYPVPPILKPIKSYV